MKINSLIKNTVLAMICLLLVIPVLIYEFPLLVGADGSYTVMSGSMSPALRPGDLVIIKEEGSINIDDMVTVESGEFTYTHRVVEKLKGDRFRLKGDANEEPDQGLIEASQIIGKVVLVFPFGHLYTRYGFAAALLAPAALIIGKQMHTVYQHTKKRNRRATMRWRRKSHSALDTGTLLLALILTVSTTRVIAPHFIAGSSSYFSDTEWATGSFRAGIWVIGADIDIDPDTLNLGNPVINLGSEDNPVPVIAYIKTEYDPKDIIVNTVMLDDTFTVCHSDIQGDTLMVQFDRTIVEGYLIGKGCGAGDVTLTVSGRFTDGVRFTGEDIIQVIS